MISIEMSWWNTILYWEKNFRIYSSIEYEDLCLIPICVIFKYYIWILHFFILSNLYFCNFITGMLNFLINKALSLTFELNSFSHQIYSTVFQIFILLLSNVSLVIKIFILMTIWVNVYIHITTLQNSWHHFVTMNNTP